MPRTISAGANEVVWVVKVVCKEIIIIIQLIFPANNRPTITENHQTQKKKIPFVRHNNNNKKSAFYCRNYYKQI